MPDLGVLSKWPVGCGDNAHIHLDGLVVAHPLQFAAFHKSQQFGLQRQRHLADLIQKQRAPIRCLDAADASLYRARKCAPGMTEQLSFE